MIGDAVILIAGAIGLVLVGADGISRWRAGRKHRRQQEAQARVARLVRPNGALYGRPDVQERPLNMACWWEDL